MEEELKRLQQQGIISPVTHSDWATPIVPISKPDRSVRICGDYKVTVNPAAKIDSYPLPKIDDLFTKIAGAKIFPKLDLAHAYQQLELTEDAKRLTTINTHKGLFQYNRLPFGISSAPAIFQRTLENLLADIPNVANYLDDILVAGRSKTEHLETQHTVFNKLREAGLTLKKSKCHFGLKSVSYLGHVIDEYGLHPSTEKVKDILDALTPSNTKELRAFLGLTNYYQKFSPNLSCLLCPLCRLLQEDTPWIWTKIHEVTFKKTKELFHFSNLLVHFDPEKPIIVTADASPYGLGAVLSHRLDDDTEKPIMFTSRTLSPAELKYSQIEKEALAIIFAVKQFHQYIHGQQFEIQSDHKPLKFLFNPLYAVIYIKLLSNQR